MALFINANKSVTIKGIKLYLFYKNVSENEIYDDFAKIYRKCKILNRQKVGDYFFKEMEDLVNKLSDDFEVTVRNTDWQPM